MDNMELQYYCSKLYPQMPSSEIVAMVGIALHNFEVEMDKFKCLDWKTQDKIISVLIALREGL